ncbi:FG-GAP repeat domain-containing protein [Mucilaginibacter antarcticus]|uniref:FG-GAP-like repeat-containing protein n=1 Tax=Mucilaginibacter antarcticus TaxID=1855725 RepID=A0ABW5XSB0_9SPHI
MRHPHKILVIALLTLIVIGLAQCGGPTGGNIYTKDGAQADVYSDEDVAKGEALAAKHCQSCHSLPSPSLLNKVIWKDNVLPLMGEYLGLKPAAKSNTPRIDAAYKPSSPAMDERDWRLINAYFITKAPDELPIADRAEPTHQLPFFEVQSTPAEWVATQAFTSYVKIDQSVKPHRLIVCDGLNNKLVVLNDKGQTISTSTLDAAIVDLNFQSDKILASVIGFDLKPNDIMVGSINQVAFDNKGAITIKAKPLFDRLNRPLSVNLIDLNQDGKKDYLINQYGNMAGKLSWFEGNTARKEHVLREKPGCIKAIIDYNNPGKVPDIWALFAQGDEGVFMYANKGKGIFEEKKILSFPPSYGSISFDLVDFNGDGFKDILYACGDNADHSQILKPYHGVYIYLNDGKNNFSQKYFYPINGCNKVIASDFDRDGDLDLAAVSAYPSEKIVWEGFIYFENTGGLNFKPYTPPSTVKFTHGMTIDAADIDGDGKTDLLLGGAFSAKNLKGNDKHPLFLVLKNIVK